MNTMQRKFLFLQVLYIGSLINKVPQIEVEKLLDVYGEIKEIYMGETFAKVHIECERSVAEEVCKSMDWNQWMDNCIRVQFAVERRRRRLSFAFPAHDKYGHCDRVFRYAFQATFLRLNHFIGPLPT